jgi:hypothetical protein
MLYIYDIRLWFSFLSFLVNDAFNASDYVTSNESNINEK